jgi:hypothetical protein
MAGIDGYISGHFATNFLDTPVVYEQNRLDMPRRRPSQEDAKAAAL